MSQRKQQRESVLLRAIQEVISRGLADPRIRGLITVTGIDLSDDGKNATVKISVLPDEHQELTMHGLRAAAARIRKDAMGKVRLKDMPRLEFAVDPSIKRQAELLRAINQAAAATGSASPDAADAGPVANAGDADNDAGAPSEPRAHPEGRET